MTSNRYQSVLAILVDGARPDVMQAMAVAGELPVLDQHFVQAGGFRAATSVFPTVSGPAHLPVLTGAHPGRANLPGIRWAERPDGRHGFFGRTRSYMAPFRAAKLERDIPAGVKTLFHHIDGLGDVNTWFLRGCRGGSSKTRLAKPVAFFRSMITKDWYGSDIQAEQGVLRSFEAGHPSVFAVFPAVDELGHRFGPLCEESYEAYRRFDKHLGRLIDALTRSGRLRETLVMLTSDHGQTGTHTHLDIDDLVAEVYTRTLSYPLLWQNMVRADAAAMVSGNAMANVYVRGARGWTERPDFETPGQAADLAAKLIAHPGIDHVIYRRGAERTFVVAGPGGKLRVTAPDTDDLTAALPAGGTLDISVEGVNPLGYDASVCGRLDRTEIARRTADSVYPDAPWQLLEFFRSTRAGDLIVCAKPGFDLRSRFEYQPHRGSHGCLHREHMMVPAAINAAWEHDVPIRSVDLFPSILTALGKPVPDGIDGQAIAIVRS